MANVLIAASGRDFSEGWPDLLSEQGHRVQEVRTNHEVLTSLDSHPDVILCEWRPASGLDCVQLAKAIKTDPLYQNHCLIPVIGFGMQNRVLTGENELFLRYYLQTPAAPYRLTEYLDRVLQETT